VPSPTPHLAFAAAASPHSGGGFLGWLRGDDRAATPAAATPASAATASAKPHRPFYERWLGIGADDDGSGATAATSAPAPALPQRRPRTAYYDPRQ
ncbi:MAG TPA: hypothetical protein VHD15_10745, partial [Hyphomicrobiales bacterium]|nr:hypothetical protein [Hyphomicrobiales bacterium]